MGQGAYHLSDVPPGEDVAIVCRRCDRRARYQLAHLIAEMGEDAPMPGVLLDLTNLWCRGRPAQGRCAAVYERPLGTRDPPVVPGVHGPS